MQREVSAFICGSGFPSQATFTKVTMAIHPLHALGFEPLLPSLTDLGFEPAMPIGATEPTSGRRIVQPTRNPAINQALATGAMPAYQAKLVETIRHIQGVTLAASRKRKNPSRLAEKIKG